MGLVIPVAEFAAQFADVAVDGAVGHYPVILVDFIHQLVPGPDTAGVAGQGGKQGKLNGGESDSL